LSKLYNECILLPKMHSLGRSCEGVIRRLNLLHSCIMIAKMSTVLFIPSASLTLKLRFLAHVTNKRDMPT